MIRILSFVFLVALFLGHLSSVRSWIPISLDEIPLANPSDQVDVWVLEAPLLYDKLGPTLGFLNLYHMGFGFHNLNTSAKWQLEFDGMPDFVGAIFPSIVKTENGTSEVKWDSFGAAIIFHGINETYWQSSRWNVARITGEQHNRYVKEYLANINQTRPYYDLFDVVDQFPNGTRYLHSFTCMDFVWDSLEWMRNQTGVQLDYSNRLKRDFTLLHVASEPTLVDFNGPHHDKIVEFYEFITGKFKQMSLVEFLLNLGRILSGEIYLRLGKTQQYYRLQLKSPFISFKYVYEPLPGQVFSPEEKMKMRMIEAQQEVEVMTFVKDLEAKMYANRK